MDSTPSASISDTSFYDNKYGLFITNSSPTLSGCYFHQNKYPVKAGENSNVMISNSKLEDCTEGLDADDGSSITTHHVRFFVHGEEIERISVSKNANSPRTLGKSGEQTTGRLGNLKNNVGQLMENMESWKEQIISDSNYEDSLLKESVDKKLPSLLKRLEDYIAYQVEHVNGAKKASFFKDIHYSGIAGVLQREIAQVKDIVSSSESIHAVKIRYILTDMLEDLKETQKP